MKTIDIIIVLSWLVITFLAGFLPGLFSDFEGFWLNNKKTKTALLVFTIVATQVGGGTIIGIASSTYKNGLGFGIVALASTFVGFLLIGFFAHRIKELSNKINAFTLSEIIGYYYGKSAQKICGAIIIFAYLSLLAGQIVAATTLISVWSGFSFQSVLWFSGISMIAYCAFAGLKGDIISDTFHFWGKIVFYFLIFLPVLLYKENIGSLLSSLSWSQISPVKFGGYTYLIGGIFFGAIIPLVSMELWMRIFSSENAKDAKKAYIISAFTIIPFYVLPMLVGLISVITIPAINNPDQILIFNFLKYLPSGLLGMGIASLFSVTIGAANTLVVVLSATFYRDILGRNNKSGKNELLFSRLITLVIGFAGIAFSLLLPNVVQLIINAFFGISIIFPPLLYGFVTKRRLNPYSGVISLLVGFILIVVFIPILGNQAFIPGLLGSILGIVVGNVIDNSRHKHAKRI